MSEDRLRDDTDEVEDLEDIIEAHDESTSHFARDIDAAEKDLEIPEDIDVDNALTFPHPKHKEDPNKGVELMDTPKKDDIDIDWQESQQDMLPTDYTDDYDDALTTNLQDEDEVVEDQIEKLGDMGTEDLTHGTPMVTRIPKGFQIEEGEPGEKATPPVEMERFPGELESAMETGSETEDMTIAERYEGEVEPETAKELLRRTKPGGEGE